MADFPIQVRVSEYDTEHGHRVHAKRGYVLCEFTVLPILCDAFVDTAAPFSVVPYTISRHLSWNQLAKTLTSARTGAVAPLTWQAIPCDLGAITVRLIHPVLAFGATYFRWWQSYRSARRAPHWNVRWSWAWRSLMTTTSSSCCSNAVERSAAVWSRREIGRSAQTSPRAAGRSREEHGVGRCLCPF